MSVTHSTQIQTEKVKTVTRPWYLFEVDFSTVLRLADHAVTTVSYNHSGTARTFTGANMTVAIADNGLTGSVRLFNEDLAYSAAAYFGSDTQGVTARVYTLYGDPTDWSQGDAFVEWEGELGRVAIGKYIDVQLIEPSVQPASGLYFTAENGFSWMPKEGTQISTNNGTFVIGQR